MMAYPARRIPYGFEDAARKATSLHELSTHFRCSYGQLYRWCKQIGVHIEAYPNATPVVMCDANTHADIRTFKSMREAAEFVWGTHSSISDCARGIRRTAYGYWWRLADDAS